MSTSDLRFRTVDSDFGTLGFKIIIIIVLIIFLPDGVIFQTILITHGKILFDF